MEKRLKERLKDIIIDSIFDYCENEIVKKHITKSAYIETTEEIPFKENSILNIVLPRMMKSPDYRVYFDKRDKEFCAILSEDGNRIHEIFFRKLEYLGYKRNENLKKEVENIIGFLKIRSYISHDFSKKNELRLTDKGRNHYKTGESFEEIYVKGWVARRALLISGISIIIAIISVLLSFFI